MKKSHVLKTLAFLLTLLMAFGVSVSAAPGEALTTQAAPIEIQVGELISCQELLDSSYAGYIVLWAQGAGVGVCTLNYHGTVGVYGMQAGPATATLTIRSADGTDTQQVAVEFNVVAAVDPLVKALTVAPHSQIPVTTLLAGTGYTLADVANYAKWDTLVRKSGSSVLVYGPLDGLYIEDGTGESQVLLNMTDGKIVLVNITVAEEAQGLWDQLTGMGAWFIAPFFLPVLAIAAPAFAWPLIFAPLLAPVFWVIGIVSLFLPNLFGPSVSHTQPALVF